MMMPSGKRQHSGGRDGLFVVAFWQVLTFFLLLLLIWTNEMLDLASLWFGTKPAGPNFYRGAVLSIGVLVVGIVTIGNTYLQQKRIIKGLLLVCSGCRKIRVDEEVWEQLDQYVKDHSLASISHGLCPHCFEEMKREIELLEKQDPD